MTSVSVAVRPRPLGPVYARQLAPGERMPTIEEILRETPGLSAEFIATCEARINDVLVPRERWGRVRPRNCPGVGVAVTFTPYRLGNGGGSSGSGGGAQKNPLATVASVAVLLIGAAVSGGALGAFIPLLAGGAAATVAGAAIGIGGSLAIAALTPPPSLSANQQQSPANDSAVTGVAAALSGNALAPGAPLPRVVGTFRAFPQMLCQPLIDLVGDLEYAEVVMGFAGPHLLTAPRAGNVNMSDIAEAVTEIQDGLPGSLRQTLVSRYGTTLTPNLELVGHILDPTTQYQLKTQSDPDSNSPQWFAFVTRYAPDEIWLTIAWPEGLSRDDPAVSDPIINQAIRVRFRRRGDLSWINCPEVHFSSNSPNPFTKTIRLVWGTMPTAPALPPSNKGPIFAYADVPGQDGSTVSPATSDWHAATYFGATGVAAAVTLLRAANVATSSVLNTELRDDRVVFYLNSATYTQDAVYEVQVMRSEPYSNTLFSPTDYKVTISGTSGPPAAAAKVYDLFKYFISSGVYYIQLDKAHTHDRAVLTRISSVVNENPIQGDNFATLSIRVHGRSLGQISVLASGYVKDWDGSGWNNITTTSNPAPHLYDILTGTLGARPLTTDIVDSAGLVAWRQHCANNGLTVNAVLEGRTYSDALTLVAAAGYARPWQSEKYGVIVDKDRSGDAPVQIFSARNSKGLTWTKAFADLPSGLRATYFDSSNDYQSTDEIVYDDPTMPDADNLQSIRYDALVDVNDVIARAEFDLAQARLRFTFYQMDVDVEAIVCQRGDLIGVQHDILMHRAGFGYISEVIRNSAGNITGLTLDGSVPVDTETGLFSQSHLFTVSHLFTLGSKTGICIRLKNGAGFLTKEITASANDDVSSITFAAQFNDPGSALGPGCLCNIGPLGSEHKRMIVAGIQYKNDLTATITMVDEAPALFSPRTIPSINHDWPNPRGAPGTALRTWVTMRQK